MGTCVSKCFFPATPTPTPTPPPTKEATKQPSSNSNAAAAVHPHPFSSPTTSSLSLASPYLSSSAASSSSSSSSSRPRKRDPFLLPNRSRSSSREWDVVVLDPNRKQLTSASSTRPASYSDEKHKKKPCSPANRIRRATEREALLLRSSAAQACSNKEEAAGSRVPEDDLANPTISMDCFIFL